MTTSDPESAAGARKEEMQLPTVGYWPTHVLGVGPKTFRSDQNTYVQKEKEKENEKEKEKEKEKEHEKEKEKRSRKPGQAIGLPWQCPKKKTTETSIVDKAWQGDC